LPLAGLVGEFVCPSCPCLVPRSGQIVRALLVQVRGVLVRKARRLLGAILAPFGSKGGLLRTHRPLPSGQHPLLGLLGSRKCPRSPLTCPQRTLPRLLGRSRGITHTRPLPGEGELRTPPA